MVALAAAFLLQACQSDAYGPWPREPMPGTQREYVCRYTRRAPTLDGVLDDEVWSHAPWSEPFVDIEGPARPAPRQHTWMKMLWDDTNLYIGAQLAETDVWATYDKHDMVVFHENDFEVFIDPDGDGAGYYEIEVNAKGTIFDLYLHKAYRDGGPALHGWNCTGVDGGVHVQGTLNVSADADRGWSVEIAIPWASLVPPAGAPKGSAEEARLGSPPGLGDTWRMNFSRVQWPLVKTSDGYAKEPGAKEDNWVWTPQWAVDMHRPEHWGRVRFTR